MQYSVLLLCFFCYLLRESHGDEDIESELLVSTALGSLSGSYFTSRSGRPFVAFRGIPYAKPPVDDLRFKDPVPTDKWDDVLDASQEGPKCNQFNWFTKGIEGVEDCLKLNVYTHDVDEDQLRPVMVWIHGGGFVFGSGNGETDMYGPANFMDKDIVFVTINYRLGPFGFLTTGDAEAPGNYGLLDQTLALKWVQQHIRSFGGDPDSVTIFGESAGAASVEFQILSPLSSGLFRRAISQSGSASALWALYDTGKEYTRTFAQHFNCSTESSSEIVDCLKTKDAVDLTSATLIMTDGYKPLVRFGPRVDRERNYPFLPAHPHQLIKSKSFNHVPYITGMNKNEGAMVIALLLMENGTLMEAFEKDRAEYIRYSLLWEKSESGREMAAKVLEFFDKELPLSEQLETIDHVYSDAFFSHSIDQAANLYAKFNEKPTYYYHYAHRGAMSLGVLLGLTTDIDIGVGHGDELFLLFDNPMVANHTTEDLEMSKLLIDLWTSFASHGAPESDLDFHWLPMSKDERRILNIDANPSMMEKLPFHDRIAFWNQLLDVTEEIQEETLLGSLVNAWQHFVQSAEME